MKPSDMPSLEKLIADIDREIGAMPQLRQDEKSQLFPGMGNAYIRMQYIRFYLSDMFIAIPLLSALEIGNRPDITPLPNLPDWVLGVSNIRGEVVSIIDIKLFLGMSSQGVKRDSRFIVVRNQEMKVGLIVDKVVGIYCPDKAQMQIQESPYTHAESDADVSSYISGVLTTEEGLLNFLDIDKLLASPRMNAFKGD